MKATKNNFLGSKALSTLSQKSAKAAEFRRCLAVFGDSRTFLRQCGRGLMPQKCIGSPRSDPAWGAYSTPPDL